MREIFNKLRPHFEKDGKLEKLAPVFEALETFLYVLPKRTQKGAHIRDSFDIKRLMMMVVIAGTPAFLFGIYNVGLQHYTAAGVSPTFIQAFIKGAGVVLPIYIVVLISGGLWEVVFASVRKHEIYEGFLVTSFLIPMILPPTIPLWQVAVATSFGIVIGKEVFGGVGMNIFNPALVTRAFLFFAYPQSMSGNKVWTLSVNKIADTFTQATPLAIAPEEGLTYVNSLLEKGYSFIDMFLGTMPGSIGETSFLLIILGGLFLLITGIGSWRIILSTFFGGALTIYVFNILAPSSAHIMAVPVHYHLVMGGFAFGAVFMTTDPVSAPSTNIAKYFYGFLIGVFAMLIRCLNPAYPEGMMLAILFMNLFSPLLDHTVLEIHKRRRMKLAQI